MTNHPGFRANVVVFLAAIAIALLPATSISLADGAHLSGKWTLNKDQSDDADKKIQDAEASAKMQSNYPGGGGVGYPGGGGYPNGTDYPGGGGGVGYPGGRGGMGGMGGMGGGRVGRGQRGPMAQTSGLSSEDMQQLSATPQMLTVSQDDKQVTITDDGGQVRNLYPDGKKHKEKDSSGQSSTVKAYWQGNRLMAESKLHSGKLTETYELSQDGKQLDVIQQLDNSHLSTPLTIRRVYDGESQSSK